MGGGGEMNGVMDVNCVGNYVDQCVPVAVYVC